MIRKLFLKTKKGVGEGMPLTDLQQYNKTLKKLVWLSWTVFLYVVIMTIYIIQNNVVNNIVANWC